MLVPQWEVRRWCLPYIVGMYVVCPRDGPRGNSAVSGGEAIRWGPDGFLLYCLGVPSPMHRVVVVRMGSAFFSVEIRWRRSHSGVRVYRELDLYVMFEVPLTTAMFSTYM